MNTHGDQVFITATQLRERWGGVSHMYIVRLQQRDPSFPRPSRFGGGQMRFWRLSEVEAWETRQ